jgi:hypothetical protein
MQVICNNSGLGFPQEFTVMVSIAKRFSSLLSANLKKCKRMQFSTMGILC